jgi:hypothetical protein
MIPIIISKPGQKGGDVKFAIAKAMGLIKIREQCPVFNHWLTEIEGLKVSYSNFMEVKENNAIFFRNDKTDYEKLFEDFWV